MEMPKPVMDLAQLIDNPTVFKVWLMAHLNKPVGRVRDHSHCPVASFVSTTFPEFTYVSVVDHEILVGTDIGVYWPISTPDWMRQFIDDIDKVKTQQTLTGGEAYHVLNGGTPEGIVLARRGGE